MGYHLVAMCACSGMYAPHSHCLGLHAKSVPGDLDQQIILALTFLSQDVRSIEGHGALLLLLLLPYSINLTYAQMVDTRPFSGPGDEPSNDSNCV